VLKRLNRKREREREREGEREREREREEERDKEREKERERERERERMVGCESSNKCTSRSFPALSFPVPAAALCCRLDQQQTRAAKAIIDRSLMLPDPERTNERTKRT
jgi:hypothetical protein